MDLYGSSIAIAIHSLDHSLSARLIAPTEICVNMNGIDYKIVADALNVILPDVFPRLFQNRNFRARRHSLQVQSGASLDTPFRRGTA